MAGTVESTDGDSPANPRQQAVPSFFRRRRGTSRPGRYYREAAVQRGLLLQLRRGPFLQLHLWKRSRSRQPPRRGIPLRMSRKKVDWDAREDQDVVTPPFLDEDDTTDMPWTDPKGTEGDKQPVTSDLIVEFDDGTGKHRVQTKWSQTCAISGHLRLRLPRCFATSQWLNCARSGGCLTPPNLHKLRPLMGGNPAKGRGTRTRPSTKTSWSNKSWKSSVTKKERGGLNPNVRWSS